MNRPMLLNLLPLKNDKDFKVQENRYQRKIVTLKQLYFYILSFTL